MTFIALVTKTIISRSFTKQRYVNKHHTHHFLSRFYPTSSHCLGTALFHDNVEQYVMESNSLFKTLESSRSHESRQTKANSHAILYCFLFDTAARLTPMNHLRWRHWLIIPTKHFCLLFEMQMSYREQCYDLNKIRIFNFFSTTSSLIGELRLKIQFWLLCAIETWPFALHRLDQVYFHVFPLRHEAHKNCLHFFPALVNLHRIFSGILIAESLVGKSYV